MSVELNYIRKGSGEPLVLMHGIGHRWQAFEPVIDRLAEHFDVIAVDHVGFGESPGLPPGESYSIDSLTDAIADNFERWGIERPHVAGNSMGGTVAIRLGQSGRARSVIAISPGGYYNPLSLLAAGVPLTTLKLGAYLPVAVLRLISQLTVGRLFMGMSLYRHPGRIDADRSFGDALAMKRARGFWPMFGTLMSAAYRVPGFLTGVAKVPTTIAWGTRDILLLPGQGRRAARLLRGARMVPIPDAGHVPMGDNPDALIAAITDTIRRAAISAR